MPGHGYTVLLGKTPRYDFEMMSQVLLEFMNKQHIEKATLVGNSWGGSWAIYFTHKYPERVKKLIIISSSGLNIQDVLIWELLKYPIIGELISKFFTQNTVKEELETVFFRKELVTPEMVQEIYAPLTFIANRKAGYLLKRNLNMKLTEQAMSQIRTSTLIIWGANDQYLPVELAQRFKELIPNAKLIVLDNCGHMPHEENPDQINQLIIDFLGDN
jgi:pimeloyl-ACP methyl ester carboxylesterase